jgi:hypothetical protein
MQFLAEQHLVAAKLVRKNGAAWVGAERELFIRKSNSFVVSVHLMSKDRGGICLDTFDWWSLTPDWSVIDVQVRRLAHDQLSSGPFGVVVHCGPLPRRPLSANEITNGSA